MTLSQGDISAVKNLASRLKVDPGTLGALFELESGFNSDSPNRWGGQGGNYVGLIQFGPGARKEVGLPNRKMSIQEQIPYVEKYFGQRGFTPGKHGPTELYRTVLVGNPYQKGTDSWGTNSDSAAKRMMPGGDLYQKAIEKLGINKSDSTNTTVQSAANPNLNSTNTIPGMPAIEINIGNLKNKEQKENSDRASFAQLFAAQALQRIMQNPETQIDNYYDDSNGINIG